MVDSILADQHPDCWGALDFVDKHMKPVKRTLVIESHGMGKPPGGGGERVYFVFKGDRRKMFLKKTSRVFMAIKLGTLDPNEMTGAALQITSVMAKNPKGSPPEVLSMTVIDAAHPKTRQQPPAAEPPPKPTEAAPPPTMRESGEDG